MTSVVLALVTLSFSMRGDRARGWPVETHITMASKAGVQEWTIAAADARKPVSLKVPPGAYVMTIAAPHHRVFTRALEVEKDLSLPEIALAPIPAISGRVVERVKDVEIALAGAQIMAGDRQLTTTNAQGLFRVELSADPLPDTITIVHAGQAPKSVPLFDNLAAENELGTIDLPRGVRVTALLDRRFDEPKMLTVSIVDKKTIARREVKPAANEVAFDGIAPGVYQIVVQGTGPLEFRNETVEVHFEDVEQKVVIAPFELQGRVLVGNESLRDRGTIEIGNRFWRTEVPIDEEGRFGGAMWQEGKVAGSLRTPLSETPIMEVSPELGPGPSIWHILLKRRFIEGRIFDAGTKEPMPKAALEVEVVSGDRRSSASVGVGKDGKYSISAMQNGRYELRVTAPDHADARRVVFVDERHQGQILDFPLEGGVEASASFAWPDGRPVAGATVFVNDGKVLKTDATGRVVIMMSPGTSRTLVALPREGSFGIADLSTTRRGTPAPVQVVVPPPAGALRVATFDKKHAPVRRPLLVSYNSRQLPPAVVERLAGGENSGAGPLRLSRLPAGFYDVWMIGAPPARVSITAGEEAVELVLVR